MSQGMFSIGGIASGLDTAGIVEQLLQLERQPMVVIEQRQQQHRKADEAWGQIVTRLSTLRTATDKLNDPSWLQKTSAASSSNDAVARVTTSGGAVPGSLAFTVESLATSHQVAVGGEFGSADATVGSGQLAVTRQDGQVLTAELGEGATLADAARALDGLDGVSARVLRVADGRHRLLVTASETGNGASFDITSTVGGLSAVASQTLTEGVDATISLGGLTLTRSSNTIDDLIEGVSVQLTGVGGVSVEVRQDLDEGVKQVKGFVDGLNGVLTQLATASKASPEARERGPLTGDPNARDLAMRLRSSLSSVQGDGTYASLSRIGISLTRDGTVSLDETKLREALSSDPQAVASLLGKASSADDPRVEISATGRSQPGTYQVNLTEAARIATVTGVSYTVPTGDLAAFTILLGDKIATVGIQAGEDLDAAVGRINADLLLGGIAALRASALDGVIRIEADRAGTERDFTITGSGALGLDGVATGASAAGTISDGIDTWALVGSGRSLSVAEGPGQGLILRVPTGVTGGLGGVTVGDGLGSVMDRLLQLAEGSGGSIARARNAVQGRIEAGNANLERFEQRLEIRERSIRRQFVGLETAMAQFNAQGNWLSQQIASMTQ